MVYWLTVVSGKKFLWVLQNQKSLVHFLISLSLLFLENNTYYYNTITVIQFIPCILKFPLLQILRMFTFLSMHVNVWLFSKKCFATFDCLGLSFIKDNIKIIKSFDEINNLVYIETVTIIAAFFINQNDQIC